MAAPPPPPITPTAAALPCPVDVLNANIGELNRISQVMALIEEGFVTGDENRRGLEDKVHAVAKKLAEWIAEGS